MKVFVDWNNGCVMSEDEYLDWLSDQVETRSQNAFDLGEYLSGNYSYDEVCLFSDDQKEKAMEDFREYLEEVICEDEELAEYSIKNGKTTEVS